jgi:hypothetical protein
MLPTPRASRRRLDSEPCRNCGDIRAGRYCPSCGQRKVDVRASLGAVFADVLQDELVLNRALPRTVIGLLFRPGFLTDEYVRGRIARYIPPLRLYLVTSIVFFLVISFIGLRALDTATPRITLPGGAAGAVDSVHVGLAAVRDSLLAIDTTALSDSDRASLRDQRGQIDRALSGLGPLRRDPAGPDRRSVESPDADTMTADTTGVEDEDPTARLAHFLGEDSALAPGTLQPWAVYVDERLWESWSGRAVRRKLGEIGHLPLRQAFRAVVADMLDYAPHMVFMLLPLFALILKLLYVRREPYYAEHFVFALHTHAFFFAMFLILLAVPWLRLKGIIVIWMMLYVWLAMKRVYRQGWFRTTLKWAALGWTYNFVLFLALFALVFGTFLLT